MTDPTVRPFKAEVSQLLKLLVNSLYSNPEVFVRELISNASDALDKLRFQSLSHPELVPPETTLIVRISADPQHQTLTFWDNGVGMTSQELEDNLGTLARSGTRQFVEAIEAAQREKAADRPQLIGQFGVGFYSAFLVADRVEVISRAAGGEQAFRWTSDAKESFSIEPAGRDVQGTSVILHLKADRKEFLEGFRLRQLIERYSDYIPHPIELLAPSKGDKIDEEPKYERVNQASALWRRPAKELTREQYQGFYKHLTHDWEDPIAYRHFQVEGTQMFYALLFLPKRPPFDLFDAESKHGMRLHVKRVFVVDNCSDLVPRYLRFVRGVVDSEDLPLNVSREVLQDSSAVRVIKKQITNHVLSLLEELRKEDRAAYDGFWAAYGTVLKEGLHFAESERARIAKLVQYESSAPEPAPEPAPESASQSAQGWVTLEDYVSRMKPEQKAIYYAAGTSRSLIEQSPHLEGLRKRGYEILYMTDPIDPFAVSSLNEFDGKPLLNAMTEDLQLGEEAGSDGARDEATSKAAAAEHESLLAHMKSVLGDKVSEVRASRRLTDSPACLVIAEGGMAPHIEQLLRARKMDVPASKRILEVNTEHPVVANLERAFAAAPGSDDVRSWIRTLYDQSLIAEGSPLEDPADFARRLTALVERATAAPA